MNKKDQERYRQRLRDLGKDIMSKSSSLSDEALRGTSGDRGGNISHTPVHLGDAGSDQYEQDVATNLLRTEREIEREIVDALDRIDQGTYGRCEDCDQEIPRQRLDTLPYARYCVSCSRKYEPSR